MRSDRSKLSEAELRELLNLGDPASDGNEPARDEIAAMRRTVLNAVDTCAAAQPWLSRSLMAATATVAVALIALAILLRGGPAGEVFQPEVGPAIGPASPTTAAPEAPAEIPEAIAESSDPVPDPGAAASEGSPPDLVSPATPQVDALAELPVAAVSEVPVATIAEPLDIDQPTVGRQPRTVQFTAPGGTRIIWKLDPNFQFPVDEPNDRARGEL